MRHRPDEEDDALLDRLEACLPQIHEVQKICQVPSITFGVVHKGSIVLQRSVGYRDVERKLPADHNTIYPIASCSKMFTSAALGILVDEGRMSWHDRVSQYLPEFNPKGDANIALEADIIDCLRHSIGLRDPTTLMTSPSCCVRMSDESALRLLNAMPTSDEKGQRFNRLFFYNNYTYGLAALILQKITGRSLADYLCTAILEPLQMNRTTMQRAVLDTYDNVATEYATLDHGDLKPVIAEPEQSLDPDSNAMWPAAAGVHSSLNDMLRWCIAVLSSEDNEKKAETTEDSTANHARAVPASTGCGTADQEHNPLKQLQRMRRGYWTRPSEDLDYSGKAACGMGWFLTELPSSMLGSQSGNQYSRESPHKAHLKNILGRDGKRFPVVWHTGGYTGSICSVFTFPETQSAVVTMTNGRILGDASDFAAQILIQALFDMTPAVDLTAWARLEADLVTKHHENEVLGKWETNRRPEDPRRESSTYVGQYQAYDGHFSLEVSVGEYIDHSEPELFVTFVRHEASKRALEFYRRDTYSLIHPMRNVLDRLQGYDEKTSLLTFEVGESTGTARSLTWQWDDEQDPVRFTRISPDET